MHFCEMDFLCHFAIFFAFEVYLLFFSAAKVRQFEIKNNRETAVIIYFSPQNNNLLLLGALNFQIVSKNILQNHNAKRISVFNDKMNGYFSFFVAFCRNFALESFQSVIYNS